MSIFVGSGVAIVTPFDENNNINYDKMGELLEFHIKNKTDAIIVVGTTGETPTLNEEEDEKLIKFTVEKINKRIPVLAGTGSNSTVHAIKYAKRAEKLGVDALLVVTPYYNKGNENGLYEHYKLIAESTKLPIMLYNVPSRTGVNISINNLKKLAKIENIVALKEASGNISYAAEVARVVPELDLYSGNDDMILPIMSLGGKGVVSVSANILPSAVHNMIEEFLKGNVKEASKIQLAHNGIANAIFIETNPVPIKEAMNYLGYGVGRCRLPLGEMKEENKEKLYKELNNYGVEKWK